MKKWFRPYSLLFYLLSIFLFIGLLYVGGIDAGTYQGLASEAIVLGYGVIATAIAFMFTNSLSF